MSERRTSSSSSAIRGNVLQRGKACIRCRRRKMKCDGGRPVCTPCIDANRVDDCEYTDNHSVTRTQLLEENVARLESRLQELEGQPAASSSLLLRDPYATPRPSASVQDDGHALPKLPLQEAWWERSEPPDQVSATLISIFLPNAWALSFALDIDRFRERASLPSSDPERPHLALLNVVYLWALRLSNVVELRECEDIYLQRAIPALQGSLARQDEHKAHHRVQSVQAEVLIALYFLCLGHNVEARYHVNAAVALAFSCSLHQIKAPDENFTSLSLPPPVDAKEREERIRVFWSVFELDACWSAILEFPRSFSNDPIRGTLIDTPWSAGPSTATSGRTVQRFLAGYSTLSDDGSYMTFRSKASAIYGKTSELAAQFGPVTETEVKALADLTTEFASRLPPLDELDVSTDDICLSMAATHSIVHASMIHLHRALTTTEQSDSNGVLTHADEIVSILEFASRICSAEGTGMQRTLVDPFLAVCGFTAGGTLTEELDHSMRGARTHETQSKRRSCLSVLGRLLDILRRFAGFANGFPIFAQYAAFIEEELPQEALRELQKMHGHV